ncbi:hypothetical protein [Aliidiomarina indica]|uniref:hypothetical protein n=1 Tax=Aliidiomarina indica TaxID=2749147 RepID=UPI001890A11A|nr:hypothetical protein [Aliidiomarina indica]
MRLITLFSGLALALVCTVVSAEIRPGDIVIQSNEGTIQELSKKGLILPEAVSRFQELGFTLSDRVTVAMKRNAEVLSADLQRHSVLNIDPSSPQDGDTRTYKGERTEGRYIYEYTTSYIYVVDENGFGQWIVLEQSKRLIGTITEDPQ